MPEDMIFQAKAVKLTGNGGLTMEDMWKYTRGNRVPVVRSMQVDVDVVEVGDRLTKKAEAKYPEPHRLKSKIEYEPGTLENKW